MCLCDYNDLLLKQMVAVWTGPERTPSMFAILFLFFLFLILILRQIALFGRP